MISIPKISKEYIKSILSKSWWHDFIAVTIPVIPYIILTIPLFGWVIDDAGISFVYSRNLAAGHGLVSQPGLEPVEGYSNPLWVFLFTPFFMAGVFDPFIVPKALSIIFVLITFYLIHRSIQLLTGTKYSISLIVLLFLGTNSSFIVWTCSGLENPLLTALIAALLYSIIKLGPADTFCMKNSVIIGLIASGIALTRPDGVLYFIVYPFAVLLAALPWSKEKIFNCIKSVSAYSIAFLVIFGGHLLFRVLYFGYVFPNTFYAKGGPTISIVKDTLTLQQTSLIKLQQILQSVFEAGLWLFIPIVIVAWLGCVIARRGSIWRELVLLLMTLITAFIYLILPNDWMGEYRLATPFFAMLFTLLGLSIYQISRLFPKDSKFKIAIVGIIVVLLLSVSFRIQYVRLKTFSNAQPASFTNIAERFGHRINQYADSLGLENASLLVPDIGGALFYSNLRIYDLAGLCDPIIARTLRRERAKFLDYIFDETKPTIIHTHGWFTIQARFDEDPRFLRDYVAIDEHEDKYAGERLKRKVMSGNYVRRDAIENPK